jgi:ABC-type bacteriocin/lantibiotic exporter with double-glycine peptidase domain
MVLLSFGVDVSESELRSRCDCTILGTKALSAVDAARSLGFTGSTKYTLTLEELRYFTAAEQFPIVFVSLLPIDARDDIHALIVVEFGQQAVVTFDPLIGERTIPLQTFSAAWGMRHNLAILIAR